LLEIPELTSALYERGFVLDSDSKELQYSGVLRVHGEQIPASLTILDLNLNKFPIIKLKNRPKNIPDVCSHLFNDNSICYAQNGLSYLDRYSPIASVLGCIEKAEGVIEKLISGDPFEDMANEFAHYWDGGVLFLDIDNIDEGFQNCWKIVIDLNGDSMKIWGNDKNRLESKYSHLNAQLTPPAAGLHIIKDCEPPKYTGTTDWPPKNLLSFLNWLKSFDHKAYKKFIKYIESWFTQKDIIHFQIIFCNDICWYGIRLKRPDFRGFTNASNYKQAVLNTFANSIIVKRLQPQRIDSERLINRNLPEGINNLINKKILLVGCGTIGGFLSFVLARLGAGFEEGELTLVDNDLLTSGNLGRHNLGFPSIGKYKVKELEKELLRDYPGINVKAHKMDGEAYENYDKQDIIIDATATGSFSHWLNEQYLNNNDFPPILFAWILGNGASAQAYLMDNRKLACLKCLNIDDANSAYSPLKKDYNRFLSNGMGCDSPHVPFSTGASMSAVALVEKLILEWASENVKMHFRNINLDIEHTKVIKPKDPSKWSQCPACSI
jgi:molybdopterin/thiamine biosynthesis adenylyltransferase